MSCNYYINTKDSEMVFDLMPRVCILPETRTFEIHLCQTVGGYRKPLFECHSYKSFKELKEILVNKKYVFTIVDEYDREINIDDFINLMTKMNNEGKSRKDEMNEIYIDPDGFEWLDCDFA